MNETPRTMRRRLTAGACLALLAARPGLARAAGHAGWFGSDDRLPSLGLADAWINSAPLTPQALRGRVVLVQFWTYSCINWLRTLPWVRAWAERYRDAGLVVIGVHSPEFGFEQDLGNVRRAVREAAIGYPVAIDNAHAIWQAFDNHYWPALYFIDAGGRLRGSRFGEGDYAQSERTLQALLAEAGKPAARRALASVTADGRETAADWDNLKSPENYLGYARTEHFASPGGAAPDQARAYVAPARLDLNQWALAGNWNVGSQPAVSNTANGRIACRFHARDLHMVLGAGAAPVRFRVLLDGAPPGPGHGIDVDAQGNGVVAEPRLYQLVRQSAPIVDRLFSIEFEQPGVQAYSFTFG